MAGVTEEIRRRRKFKHKPTVIVPITKLAFSGERFKQRLRQSFFVRFHMILILAGIGLSGVGINKLLLEFGVDPMPVRYPIAICVSYLVFFLLIRLWIWYISIAPAGDRSKRSHTGDFEIPELPSGSSSGGSGHAGGQDWSFGGGRSGGGGASDSWADAAVQESLSTPMSASHGGVDLSFAHSPPSSGGSSGSSILDGLSDVDGGAADIFAHCSKAK